MKTLNLLTLAASLALTACAGTDMLSQPPAAWERIHTAAKARIQYQNYAKRDWRYIRPEETGAGNCAVFAYTTWMDAVRAGLQPDRITVCRLPDGTGHAYTRMDGWDSDVRFKHVIPASQQDCK